MSLVKSVGGGFVASDSQNSVRLRLVVADIVDGVAGAVVVVDATGFDSPALAKRSNH
jgi:hypothetical protein